VVERLIVSMLRGKEGIYMGDPKVERDFLFREDHVSAYLTALEKYPKMLGEVFNVCTGRSVSIENLAQLVREMVGWEGKIFWRSRWRPIDIPILRGDYTKIRCLTLWEPSYTLESGLRQAVGEWREVLGL